MSIATIILSPGQGVGGGVGPTVGGGVATGVGQGVGLGVGPVGTAVHDVEAI